MHSAALPIFPSTVWDFLWVDCLRLAPKQKGKWVGTLAWRVGCLASRWPACPRGAMAGLLGGFTGFFPGHVRRPVHNKNLINSPNSSPTDEPPQQARDRCLGLRCLGWLDLIQAGAEWKWQQGAFTLSCDPERIQLDVGAGVPASVPVNWGQRDHHQQVQRFQYNIR